MVWRRVSMAGTGSSKTTFASIDGGSHLAIGEKPIVVYGVGMPLGALDAKMRAAAMSLA